MICAIAGLYDIICRDEETAEGGITPSEDTLHASGFTKHEGTTPFNDLPGDGIDRRVEILYPGTDAWTTYASSYASVRMRQFEAVVRVGYFAGSHFDETHAIIADDDRAIGLGIRDGTLPTCSSGCVNGYYPIGSSVVELDPTRLVLEIRVRTVVTL